MKREMKRKRAVLVAFSVVALSGVFAATAFACTIFRGTFTIQGNASTASVTATGLRTGMVQTVSSGVAKASRTGGSVKVSTGADRYGVKLPAGNYQVRYFNGAAYRDHTHWQIDCMAGQAGRTLGSVAIGSAGTISGQPRTFSLGTSTRTTGGQESGVCVSNSNATYGNQAPLTIL